ncbi:MAG: MFS transporter, partial [Deltaproteobacteria bacterium]|nr:MFS transporter [Deltaproteobacteria bacterium]
MLIFVGEVMFSLPFHIPRYFRATVLDVFGLSNAQLGDVFAVYGITAASAYFLGGPLADRFPARKLIATSLLATGAGGLYLSTIPGPFALAILYGYWGLTTILLFWAALIRATREWGSTSSQGRAFGFLDGGRGLVSACLASLAVIVFGWLFPAAAEH